MHVDSDSSSSPEPVSAAPEPSSAMAEEVDIDDRSNTESPQPDLRSDNTTRPTSEGTETNTLSQSNNKATETEHDVTPDSDKGKMRNASDRGSSAFDTTSPVSAEAEKMEDVVTSNCGLQDDDLAPSMGYEYSNFRVGF